MEARRMLPIVLGLSVLTNVGWSQEAPMIGAAPGWRAVAQAPAGTPAPRFAPLAPKLPAVTGQLPMRAAPGGGPATVVPRLTAGTILETLRTLPGGATQIDAAARRGAPIQALRIGPSASIGAAAPSAPSTSPAPSNSPSPSPTSSPPAAGFSITLTPTHWSDSLGLLTFDGATIMYGVPSLVGSWAWPGIGFQVTRAHAAIQLSLPKDGWYVLAVRSRTGNGYTPLVAHGPLASLWHGLGVQSMVQTWDYRSRPPGEYLYPALLEMNSGPHLFYWVVEEGQGDFLEFHAEAM